MNATHPIRPICLAICTLVLSLAAPAKSSAAAADASTDSRRFDQPVGVGAETDNYPYSYVGEHRQAAGFAVDVLDAVARAMGLRLERQLAPANDLPGLLKARRIAVMQVAVPGTGCQSFLDLSTPYLELQSGFFVRADDTRFSSPTELAGAAVVFPCEKSPGEKFLTDAGISARLFHTATVEQALRELSSGKHDTAYAPRLTAYFLMEHDRLANLRPLGNPLAGYSIRFCFGVPKGDAPLLARLNEGLAIITRSGEYDAIYQKWFGRFEPHTLSREQIVTYVAGALSFALIVALAALLHQRSLRRRLARQARQIAENETILAEAQRNARLGSWHYDVKTGTLRCSPETLRIIERLPPQGAPSYFRILSMVPRTDRSMVHRSLRGALRDGIPCEITLPCRTSPQNLRILHLTARPSLDAAGRIASIFGTVQDITRQKAAEESLRAREQLLRALYENVPTAMGVIEETGSTFRFISANPGTARLLGLHNTVLANHVLGELPIAEEAVAFWTSWFRKGLEHSDIYKSEQLHESSKRHYAVTLVPLTGGAAGDTRMRQLCYLIDDVTERKEIDAEIAQGRRLRAIGELVGGIAHEFNNLLTPIMLKTELLACEWSDNPRLLEELRTISRAAKRGADLTRRLLTFGRRADIRPEELQLHAVIRANFDLLQPTIDRRIVLESSVPESLPPLFLNSSALHQILLNLLLNARDTLVDKLNQHPGQTWEARIRVVAAESAPPDGAGARSAGRWIKLTIRDNGMGMSSEVQERIFEPFYTTKEVGKGTGLGLATVWNLVSRLGGRITVESEPGQGSAFHVWLPVAVATSAPRETRPPLALPSPRTTARILLVEDDELVARTVASLLTRVGHQVTHLTDGHEAWSHLQSHPNYDVLLLDLDIPGINGIEIARRARAHHFPGRILVASGRLGDNETRELDAIQVDARLQKPFPPHVLTEAIQAILAGTEPAPATSPSA